MSSIAVFRRTGGRVNKLPNLVGPVNNIELIDKVRRDTNYGLVVDMAATYNNPATEETVRAKATPKVKEMKGQLISSLKTQALSPKTSVKSPVTGLPRIYATVSSDSAVSSPGRTILRLPGQSGTKILPTMERSKLPVVKPVGQPVVTSLAPPKDLNIDPRRISYGKASKNGAYTVKDLKAILRGLGQPLTGNKGQLVNTLVEYLRENDPGMFSQLSDAVKTK